MVIKNKRLLYLIKIISIINILFTCIGYLMTLHEMFCKNIMILSVLIIGAQIFNIIIIKKIIEEKIKKKNFFLVCMILILIITVFIPNNEIIRFEYTMPDKDFVKKVNEENKNGLDTRMFSNKYMGSTTTITELKNIYWITLKKLKKEHLE